MHLKWKKHQCLCFFVGKCHIIAVFDFTLWLLIKKIYLSINKSKFLPWVFGKGRGASKSTKLANYYYYCQKRSKSAWKSKILGGRFENVMKEKIKQIGVRGGDAIRVPSLMGKPEGHAKHWQN